MTETRSRLRSLDVVRGVVMVLMAIDHVRVYSGVPAGGPTLGIFFTRWITHFCAPAFAFLAGTGAFFHGRALNDTRALSRYLLSRGLILVVLELTVIRFSWTFNFNYGQFTLAGVIWMLGWCMVLMAGLVRLKPRTVGWIGLAIVTFQQLLYGLPRITPDALKGALGWVWQFLYTGGQVSGISILYVIVPWVGVMAAGYGFGLIMARDPAERDRLCLRIGLSATALFIVGAVIVASRSGGGEAPPFIVRMLNQQKYPASQFFLLMTLGPTIALLPYAERARGWLAGVFVTFGRVPMFYYLLHIPTIHVVALITWWLRTGTTNAGWFASAPFVNVPEDARWGLPLLYLVFFSVVVLLYFPCRWFAGFKARSRSPWLRYI